MPAPPTPPGTVHRTIIRDKHGDEVLAIVYGTYMVQGGQGRMIEIAEGDNFVLVDGTVWSPAFLKGPRPMRLAVCEICRRPPWWSSQRPSHGLCAAHVVSRCVRCGDISCPNHGHWGIDGQWRCVRCLPWFRLWCLFSRPVA